MKLSYWDTLAIRQSVMLRTMTKRDAIAELIDMGMTEAEAKKFVKPL